MNTAGAHASKYKKQEALAKPSQSRWEPRQALRQQSLPGSYFYVYRLGVEQCGLIFYLFASPKRIILCIRRMKGKKLDNPVRIDYHIVDSF
ncbi:MAG TPA: hypothetical protein IAB57_03350 [Candidatus Fimivivens faecavium]|nr:hypothetical protein [Candidatus Fimivivens faecavium]